MKAPEENIKNRASASGTNGVAPSQKRRPPKLQPTKLAKRTTSSSGQSQGSQQGQDGSSGRSKTNNSSEAPNSIAKEQRQGSLNTSSQEQTSEDESQMSRKPTVKNRRTTVRRESAQSADPDQVQLIEREQRSDSPGAQTRDTRVRQMLGPEVANQEVVPASGQHAGASGELLPNGTNANAGQVTETTETVSNEKRNDQLRLRLDLNLDIEIELKAKIRGDLTLQLLQ
jgi:hypothetical protein